jgi:hypothetical protein
MLPTPVSAPAGLKTVGRLPAKQKLNLAITLRLRNQEELKGLLEEIYNPASPNYRHYLTVEEFTDRFGPTVEDHERVREFARSNGLAVTHLAANRLVVDVNGAVEDIERGFGVKMYVYRHPVEARTFYAPDVEPSVDASLPIQGIAGLSNLHLLRPASALPMPAASAPSQTGGSGLNGTYLASDLRAAYVPAVTLNGAGQAIGLVEANGYRISDIQGYFSTMGQSLSVPIVSVLLDGEDGTCGVGCDDTEEALDIEMALALAPNLSAVIVYEGTVAADILNQMAADNLAEQLSCSYVFEPDPSLYEPIFQEFAAQGQSFLASSGDGGAYSPPNCTNNCWTSRFPADDPYVTAVGGTELITDGPGGAWGNEIAWPSSGGGINSYGYAIQSYQAPLINSLNQGSTTLRNIPDVAAVAFNVYVEANGNVGGTGGTSASAPLWASFLALANQQANGVPVGFLNPAVYGLAQKASYTTNFHDIVSGNNFNSFSPDLFSAVPGYDLVTGLGSPNGQNLINALAMVNTGANFALLSSPATLTVVQGELGGAQITLQAVNGFSGTVNLRGVVIGQPAGVTASLSPTSITAGAAATLTISTTSAVSTPSLLVCITGTSGSLTQSVYIPVMVLLPNLVETAVSSPPASVTPGSTFSVTDTVENSGQAPAGSSVTQYYLSSTTSKNDISYLVGSRSVPALSAGATSSGTANVTVPAGIWPNTAYYLVACANDTNTVAAATSGNCIASLSTTIYSLSKTPTTTSLTVTSSGAPATSVSSGAVVTLTATVQAGTTPVNPGQVNFCDATAAHCEDSHLLGTAQLTPSGAATIRFFPGSGAHSYKAVFAGTTGYATSSSGGSSLLVVGTHPTTTTITEGASAGGYSLTATVTGADAEASPSGTVSFLDTSNRGASLGSAPLVAGAPSPSWLNSQTPATGADPMGIATADFNGDGIPDLAVTNRNDGTVTILLGKGDGTFTPAAPVPNVIVPQTIVVADFNGDGIPDLAVANTLCDTVTILLGKGDGAFTPAPAMLNTGVWPLGLEVGDFNGDGIPDLAVANDMDHTISIFLGNGDGTFTAAPAIQLPGSPQGLAVADFNGDGKLDLAVPVAYPSSGTIEVLLGNGDGTFTASGASLPVGVYPSAIVSADFNGDGIPDLAVTMAESNTLAIFLGNGDGTFQAVAANPPTGDYPLSLVSADFNEDGTPDLAVANYGGNTVTILLGNGDGTFAAMNTNAATGDCPIAIVAAAFNGEGIPDLATANEADNTASVLLTQLTETATATVNGVNPSGVGTHLVDASYPGDTNYSASVSTTVALTALATPTVTVTPSSSSISTAQPLDVTVTVNGTPTPSGTVTLSSGNYASAATPLAGGSATVVIPAGALAVGSDTLTATYAPDTNSSSIYSNATGTSSPVTVAAANPVPVLSSISPAYVSAGSNAFSLTVTGSEFISGSVVYWGATALVTQFVSATQLTAQVTATQIAGAGQTAITVQSPKPGGGPSNTLLFEVDTAGTGSATAPVFTNSVATVAAGGAASYPVTLPSSATDVSASCLNLPAGATCSYSTSSGAVTIATSSTTPAGTYQITVVFTETLPGAALGFLFPLLVLPFLAFHRRKLRPNIWISACLALVLLAGVSSLVGCGGGGSVSSPPVNPTHQVNSSGVVTLTVQGTSPNGNERRKVR